MTKNSSRYTIAVLVIVIILGYLFFSPKPVGVPQDLSMETTKLEQPSSKDETPKDAYLEFNQSLFEENKLKRRVLFFYASWCTTCRPVNAEFLKETNKIPDDVVVFRVNYRDSDTDEIEKSLAEKYNITYQHTFVQINQQGDVIKKWNGGNLADLIKNVN